MARPPARPNRATASVVVLSSDPSAGHACATSPAWRHPPWRNAPWCRSNGAAAHGGDGVQASRRQAQHCHEAAECLSRWLPREGAFSMPARSTARRTTPPTTPEPTGSKGGSSLANAVVRRGRPQARSARQSAHRPHPAAMAAEPPAAPCHRQRSSPPANRCRQGEARQHRAPEARGAPATAVRPITAAARGLTLAELIQPKRL